MVETRAYAALLFPLGLFHRLGVSGLGVLVRELAMFLGGSRMLLRLFVFAHRVVVLGLKVVMRRRVVMTSRSLMVLRRRMFRHLSAPCFESPDPKGQSSDISLLVREFLCVPRNLGILAVVRRSRPGRGRRDIGRRRLRPTWARAEIRLSVTGVETAPALFYGLAMNVMMMPLAGRLLWSQRDGYDSGGGRQEA